MTRFLHERGVERISIMNSLVPGRIGKTLKDLLASPREILNISCLNGAAVMAFLNHVLLLEGYDDEIEGHAAGAEGRLKQRNFPWWDNSLWLPLEFDDPGRLDFDPTFFVGNCQRLISELDEMRQASPLDLARAPSAYDEMRGEIGGQCDSDPSLSDDESVRWVWSALHDGAEAAIAQKAGLWMGPD